mmetsp:Transcript_64823/g.146242  ORF Transcript_64823/g.146242 Transcript_64823/m.146242 type:complete len:221 (-) Transcript_64823:1357-2019(-)
MATSSSVRPALKWLSPTLNSCTVITPSPPGAVRPPLPPPFDSAAAVSKSSKRESTSSSTETSLSSVAMLATCHATNSSLEIVPEPSESKSMSLPAASSSLITTPKLRISSLNSLASISPPPSLSNMSNVASISRRWAVVTSRLCATALAPPFLFSSSRIFFISFLLSPKCVRMLFSKRIALIALSAFWSRRTVEMVVLGLKRRSAFTCTTELTKSGRVDA